MFHFRLCRELGVLHPDYLLQKLTANQLIEWEEYDKLEPLGDWKSGFYLSYLLSTVTNLFIGAHGKKGSKLTKPDDFLIKWYQDLDEPEKQSVSEMKNILMALAASQNKKGVQSKRQRK